MSSVTTEREQLQHRLVDIDRRLRHVAGLIRPVAASAGAAGGPGSELDGAPAPPTDLLLDRIERATATLAASTAHDAAALLLMRALLADVSLVTAAFRGAATVGARHLDEARALLDAARPTMTESGAGDRMATS